MDASAKAALVVGGVALAGGGAALAYAWATGTPRPRPLLMVQQVRNRMQVASSAVFRDALTRFAGTGRFRDLATAPATAKRLPIVPTTNASPIDYPGNPGMSGDGIVACLVALRAALSQAGRGDEDPRCVLMRLAEETGWFRYCQNNAVNNVKAPSVYASRESITAAEPYVMDDRYPQATSIHLLVDRINSFDAYYGFDSLGSALAFAAAWFTRNNYVGVQDAYRRGDLQGLIDAESILAQHGYSTGYTVTAAQTRSRGYWARCTRLCGSRWVR